MAHTLFTDVTGVASSLDFGVADIMWALCNKVKAPEPEEEIVEQ